LSCEISLKALLEKAGVPIKKIRKRSHDLSGLLRDIGDCEIEIEISCGEKRGRFLAINYEQLALILILSMQLLGKLLKLKVVALQNTQNK